MLKRRLLQYSHWLRCGQDGSSHAVQTLNVRLKLGTVGVLMPGAVAVTRELGGLEGDVVCEGGELTGRWLILTRAVMEEVNKLWLYRPGGGGRGRGTAGGGSGGKTVRRLLLQIKHIVTVTRGGVAGSLVSVIALAVGGRTHIHAGEHWGRAGGVTMMTSMMTST